MVDLPVLNLRRFLRFFTRFSRGFQEVAAASTISFDSSQRTIQFLSSRRCDLMARLLTMLQQQKTELLSILDHFFGADAGCDVMCALCAVRADEPYLYFDHGDHSALM